MTELWVVVPTCREHRLKWVMSCFKRQLHRDAKLVIVENGPAVGGCQRLGLVPDVVVTSRENVSDARNAGVEAVVKRGGGWIAMWDDDDYYGRSYLQEASGLIVSGKAEVYGKHRHFVWIEERGLYLFGERWANSEAERVHGPSLIFRAEDALEFQQCPEAEEYRWCYDMKQLGARIWAASIHHLCYCRHRVDHTWNADDSIVVAASEMAGAPAYYLGPLDLRLVDGEKDWRQRVVETKESPCSAPVESWNPENLEPVALRVLEGERGTEDDVVRLLESGRIPQL